MRLFLKISGIICTSFLLVFSLSACNSVQSAIDMLKTAPSNIKGSVVSVLNRASDDPTGIIFSLDNTAEDNTDTVLFDDTKNVSTELSEEISYISSAVTEYDIMSTEYTSSSEPIVVVDNDDLTISIDLYSENDHKLTVSLTNKTEDVTLMFSLNNTSVNNIMFDPSWASTVDPGDTVKSDIFFLNLYKIGVNQIQNIEMTFFVYNNNSWEDGYLINESVRLNIPLSDPDSATTKLTSNSDFEDIVLIDNDDIKITVYDYDSTDDPAFKLYLQNKTDKTVMVCSDDEYVNSVVCDPSWAVLIAPGKNAYSIMSWKSDDLSKRNISSIHSVEILLKVYDRNDWEADYIVCETVDWSA